MKSVVLLSQIVVALGIFNVWILRFRKTTNWRGGNARNLTEELQVYGLPGWFMGLVGSLKLLCATLLIAGSWFPNLTKPAAVGMAVLMLGALFMHLKVKDPLQRSLPAFCVLALCVVIAVA
jgi:uncharacterized membrane protein YphA (DoxX/SURF4 family)